MIFDVYAWHAAERQKIERARYATMLLQEGVSIQDTVEQAGYADQPHLTRALKHLIGKTPDQIVRKAEPEQLSLLFKTELLAELWSVVNLLVKERER